MKISFRSSKRDQPKIEYYQCQNKQIGQANEIGVLVLQKNSPVRIGDVKKRISDGQFLNWYRHAGNRVENWCHEHNYDQYIG